jgi:hypothetical protein
MTTLTYYVALPFIRADDGAMVPGEAFECPNASACNPQFRQKVRLFSLARLAFRISNVRCGGSEMDTAVPLSIAFGAAVACLVFLVGRVFLRQPNPGGDAALIPAHATTIATPREPGLSLGNESKEEIPEPWRVSDDSHLDITGHIAPAAK